MHRLPATLFHGFVLFLAFAAPAAGSGSGEWYPLAGGPPGAEIEVRDSVAGGGGVDLFITVPGLSSRTVQTASGIRGVLEIPGSGQTAIVGSPRLPVIRRMVEVPPGSRVSIDLEIPHRRTISLRELGIEIPLVPVQPPVPKIPGAAENARFVEDAKVYSAAGLYPHREAAITDRAVIRGRHVALVELYPVRYNPTAGTVDLWAEATVRLSFTGGKPEAAAREKGRLSSPMLDDRLDASILGTGGGEAPSAPRGAAGGATEGAEGMLVISHDSFVDAIQPLVDWKRKTGFKVEVVRTSDLGAGPTDSDVKDAIQQRYSTWSGPALGFVLLVGDTDFTPIHLGSGGGKSQVTDNWYACLDGTDYLPEIAIARISTRTAAETSNVVDKLLTYEQATFTDLAWPKRTGFIGTSDSGYISLIEDTHDWCIDTYYTPNGFQPTAWSHGGASCDRHYNSYDADTSEIAASVDDGRTIVNYSGHGGYYSWEGPTSHGSYDQDDIRANSNDGMYPFVISNACITGTLDREECFGETWLKEPGKGAIAFWGASNNSYWDEDDVLQRNLHGNIFPMDETPPIGVIVNETKIDLYNHYGDTGDVAYYFDMYNLLSEPTLSLWTRAPMDWTVSYDDAHPIGESSFAVSVTQAGQPVEGALVAVRKTDEGVFEAGYTDAAGEVTLQLDPAPEIPGLMEVTATKHDFRPHEGTTEVISPDSPWLVHRSHAVDDAAGGDGDGYANPGESFVMPVTVENVGDQPGTGLYGTLTTTSPEWCSITDPSASFPDLAAHQTGTSLPDHFAVQVGSTAPDGAMLGFDMAWSASDGSSGTTSFKEMVRAVDLQLDGYAIDDAAEGNGNGVAGPGETVEMVLTLSNIGHRDASGISGVLSTGSPYITILQDSADFPDLAAGNAGDSLPPPYRFAVSSDAPDQQPVTFDLALDETGSGHAEVLQFDVLISSCATSVSPDVPKQINDNSTVVSVFDYAHAIEIAEINVFVEIHHTYQGDLRVILESPSGTTCVLHDRTGSSTDDIITWYDTETEPAEPLAIFNGENTFGEWNLIVEDHAGSDTGTLDGWKLEICGPGIPPVAELVVAGVEVDDAAGCDPDGIGDVGETAIFNVTVLNDGWGDATSVQAVLSSAAEIAVLNNPVDLPDLALGEQAVAPFEVMVGAVGCTEHANFTVDMTAVEGSWADGFTEMLEADVSDTVDLEDLEHGGAEPPGWSHHADQGIDDWQVIGDLNHTAGGVWSWFCSDVETVKDDRLVSPPYSIQGTSTLEFWHWVNLEPGYDGGVIEISDDDGANWTDLGPYITQGVYDRSLSGSNPIAGRDAWTTDVDEWKFVSVDLTPWDGQEVRIRWRLTTDGSVMRTGWWVDDITVSSHVESCDAHACGVPGEVQVTSVDKDGGEVVLEWWDDPVCTEFRIWRSADPSDAGMFSDVTSEDPDPTDNLFRDGSPGDMLFWIIQGIGPDGDGPWGHYGQ